MYLEHFGLTEKPFNITPNPQFIFLSHNHKEVFAHLLYGLQNRCGFIEITGEVGAGKTTVLRTLFEQLEEAEFRLAFVFNPSLSADELLLEICRELGIETGQSRGGQLLPLINSFLLAENSAGRTVVLVIDEAQNLAAPVLEQIRLLSNLETETDKLIQIILVGQPELAEVLGRTNLRQLNQRISVRYHLRPMNEQDSVAYIRHRLKIAGSEEPDIFSAAALKLIFRESKGLPRLINIIADRSLLAAFSDDCHRVERPQVKTALAELRSVSARSGMSPLAVGIAAATIFFVAAAAFALYLLPISKESESFAADSGSNQQNIAAPQPEVNLDSYRASLASYSETRTFSLAAQALAAAWHLEFVDQLAEPFASFAFIELLEQNSWQWTSYQGDFSSLAKLDAPVIIESILPGVSGRRYLAITGKAENLYTITPSLNGLSAV